METGFVFIFGPNKNAEGPPDSTTGLKTMRKAGTSKTKNPVPRLASALLSLFTPFENRASILGDYEEMFDDLALRRGPLAARAWYDLQDH